MEKPSTLQTLLELRAALEVTSLVAAMPLLKKAPKGQGPVLVLPGFFTSDNSTFVLRKYLTSQGYDVYPWELGRNPGLQEVIFNRLVLRIRQLTEKHQQKVSLVGWSLGGLYARTLAHRMSDSIEKVITLGSPFSFQQQTNMDEVAVSGPIIKMYEKMNPRVKEDKLVNGEPWWETSPPVPSSAIYSESDGVASWEYCVDEQGEQTENIRIMGSHAGLTHNPMVYYVIAERLAQNVENWTPFEASFWHRHLFPKVAMPLAV